MGLPGLGLPSSTSDANGVFSNVLNDLDENGVIDSVGPSTSTSTSPTPDGYEYQVPTNGPTFIDAISQPENPFLSDQSADDPFGDTSGPYSSTTYDSDGDLVNDAFDRNPTADEEGYYRSESSRYPDEDG